MIHISCKKRFLVIFVFFITRGNAANTKGTAFVVYEDIFDAKNACEHLSGFNVCNRYLVVLYYQPHKVCVCVCVCVGGGGGGERERERERERFWTSDDPNPTQTAKSLASAETQSYF